MFVSYDCNYYCLSIKNSTKVDLDLVPLNLYNFFPGKVLLSPPGLILCFSQEKSLFSHGRDLAMSVGLLLGEAEHGSGRSDGEQGSVSPLHHWLEENRAGSNGQCGLQFPTLTC